MKKGYILLSLCVLLFGSFSFYDSSLVKSFDITFREFILSLRTEWLNKVVLSFTHVGDAKVLGGLCLLGVITLFLVKQVRNGVLLLGSIVVSYGLNLLVKSMFQRERPMDFRLLEEDGYSFPSGNAMVGTTFYLFAAVLIYQRYQKRWILWAGVILPFLLGVSRVYVGVHYPSDILAGMAFGVLLVLFFSKLTIKSVQNRESVNRNNTNTAL